MMGAATSLAVHERGGVLLNKRPKKEESWKVMSLKELTKVPNLEPLIYKYRPAIYTSL